MVRVTLLLLIASLVGCSSRPADQQIALLINGQIDKELGEGVARVENLTKTNGYEKSASTYVAVVEFDLLFLKSLSKVAEAKKQEAAGPLGQLGAGLYAMTLAGAFGEFEAGDRKHLERDITLIRTEKGWRLDTES